MKETFNEYQDSIMTAIAQNTTGENWPQHARLACYKSRGVLLRDEAAAADHPFDLGDVREILSPFLVVKDVTNLFAVRYAGGNLTQTQAFVVGRALLRLWLYQALFGEPWNLALLRRRDRGTKTLVRERQRFLDAFPPRERAEIDVVHHFLLKSICFWAVDRGMMKETGRSIARDMISSELQEIFDTMLDCKVQDLFEEGYDNQYVEHIGFVRGATPVAVRDGAYVDALILNGDRLSEVACHHCNEKGKEIWSPATYAWTEGLWGTPTEMATKLLKPYLSPDEQDDFVTFLKLLEDQQYPFKFVIYAVLRRLHQWFKKERENLARVVAASDADNVEDGSEWDTDDSEAEEDEYDSGDDGDESADSSDGDAESEEL